MVQFKPLKYKHQFQAQELLTKLEAGELTQRELDMFIMSLVQTWDYIDPDTGQLVPVGQPDELTIEQYNDCVEAFNQAMGTATTVPKASASLRSSGSKQSKRNRRSSRTRQSG